MKKVLIITLFLTYNVFSQDITGLWQILDSETKQVNSIVKIYEENGLYFGKIIEVPRKDYIGKCTHCIGKYKDKDLIGIKLIVNLKKNNTIYENGKITDPENGKTYNCYVKLIDKNKLKIRGYIGFSMFGRTEYWYRKNNAKH